MATTAPNELVAREWPIAISPPGETKVSLEEYLKTSYRPDRDWIDGEVKERNMGEGQHAVVQKFLAMFLGNHEEEWNILALTEQRVQVSATHFRVPDVCVLSGGLPFEAVVHTPPLLCVEIFSRDDTATEMMERVEDYQLMGVKTVWMIDPRRRSASIVDASGTIRAANAELVVPDTMIRLSLANLFAQLNRLEGR